MKNTKLFIILASVGVVLIAVVGLLSYLLLRGDKVQETSNSTEIRHEQTVEFGMDVSENTYVFVEVDGITYLVYEANSDISDADLQKFYNGAKEVCNEFGESYPQGLVVMNPTESECDVLICGMRTTLTFEGDELVDWQGHESASAVQEFAELQQALEEHISAE